MEENKITIEKIKELGKTTNPKTRFETYQNDLLDYLISKIGDDVSPWVLMEVAQFAMVQTQIVVNDEVWRARNEWSRNLRKSIKRDREGEDNGGNKS